MLDKQRTSYRNHVHNRQAMLQLQLLKTRDAMNELQFNKTISDEARQKQRQTLEKREHTLLEKLEELKREDVNDERSQPPSPVFVCDRCRTDIPLGAERHHCIECENFDLCSKCFVLVNHEHPTTIETRDTTSLQRDVAAGKTTGDVFNLAFRLFATRPCLGWRRPIASSTSQTPSFEERYTWLTFSEVYQRALAFGFGLRSHLQIPDRSFVAICSLNRVEWFVADFACILHAFVVVPVHHATDVATVEFIISNSGIVVAVCSKDTLALFTAARDGGKCPSLKHIVVMDTDVVATGIVSMSTVIDRGSAAANEWLRSQSSGPPARVSTSEDLVTVIYTSGSTGRPKGAMFPDRLWRDLVLQTDALISNYDPLVGISKDSLAHISDRESVHDFIVRGGRVGMISNVDTVFEDIRILSPSCVSATPRFWNVLYSEYQRLFAIRRAELGGDAAPPLALESARQEVLNGIRSYFGKRIKHISTGGAPTSAAVEEFLLECCGNKVSFFEGYGCTEAGMLASAGTLEVHEFKLVDVPELGYFATDKPHPRGELCVKTKYMIPGYLNAPEETANMFDSDGWFHTGDIVELINTDKIRIIDRKKSIFKLSQGEFVAPEKLENIYISSPLIGQVFVTCGDITRFQQNGVIAIVVPNRDVLRQWAASAGGDTSFSEDFSELCSHPLVYRKLLQELVTVGLRAKMRPFELPCGLIVEPMPFTVENGLMTSSDKLCRPALERHYRSRVNNLLESMHRASSSSAKFQVSTADGTVRRAAVVDLLSEALGIPASHVAGGDSFAALGGDSLSAVRLSSLFRERLQTDLPAELLFKEGCNTVDDITRLLDTPMATAEAASGKSTVAAAIEEDISWILQGDSRLVEQLRVAKDLPRVLLGDSARVVFLTGATGFLGNYLLVELLEQTLQTEIVCVVRPTGDVVATSEAAKNAACERLWSSLKSRRIPDDVIATAMRRVTVLVGDITQPRLGLATDDEFDQLCRRVDIVLHNAADVNHVLPYEALRNDNVRCLRELLRLVTCHKRKRLVYVSSVSVFHVPRSGRTVRESDSVENESPYVDILGGYSQTKWACECALQRVAQFANGAAAITSGNPSVVDFIVVRPGLVGWHSQTGVGNRADWLNRTMRGIAALGIAPQPSVGAYVDVTPVDYVAMATVKAALRATPVVANAEGRCHDNAFHPTFGGGSNCGRIKWELLLDRLAAVHAQQGRAFPPPVAFELWHEQLLRELESLRKAPKDSVVIRRIEELSPLLLFPSGLPNDRGIVYECEKVQRMNAVRAWPPTSPTAVSNAVDAWLMWLLQ